MNLKKIIMVTAGLGAIALLAYWLTIALASDETKIRWLVEDMRDAFNEGSARKLSRGLADEFRDQEHGLDRRQVALFFMTFVRNNLDNDKEFIFRAEFPSEDILDEIEVNREDEPPTASIRVTVDFFRRGTSSARTDLGKLVVTQEFTATLVIQGGDWLIRKAQRRIIEGSDPF